MAISLHETCQQYFDRRIREGWKCISLEGYNAVLLSPEGIIRPVDLRSDIDTLRPNANGDETVIPVTYPGSEEHWTYVDEVVADDDGTYVGASLVGAYKRDLYNLSAPSGSGIINKITLYFRVMSYSFNSKWKGAIKTGGAAYETVAKTPYSDFGSGVWGTYTEEWTTNPGDGAWTWELLAVLQAGFSCVRNDSNLYGTQVYVEIDYVGVSAPIVTTQAVTDILTTTATGNGNITDTGGENPHTRGICWNTAGAPTTADSKSEDNGAGSYGTGAFSKGMTGLSQGQLYYVRAYAINSAGTSYGGQVSFTTKAIVTGSALGSGIGLATSASLLDVLAQASASGIGLATSASLLDVLAQASASGIGLATSTAKLDVLASALGNGIGIALASPYLIVSGLASGEGVGLGAGSAYLIIPASASGEGVGTAEAIGHLLWEGTASGSGIGEATTQAILDVLAQVSGEGIGLGSAIGGVFAPIIYGTGAGSGVGTATAQGILDVLASAAGSGVGSATAQAILDILAEASGSGVGLGTTDALIKVLAAAAASGEGLGAAEALLEVIAEATGSGIGSGQSQSYIIVFGSATGSGIGLGLASGQVLVKVSGFASGSGIGLAEAEGEVWFWQPTKIQPSRLEIIRLEPSRVPLGRDTRRS